MPDLPLELLRAGAKELGLDLGDGQLAEFEQFAQLLMETNEHLNLTRITEPDEIVTGHYLDSLTCLRALKIEREARVVDVGTGAGFPGIPVKIARPDLRLTLMDSSRKKLDFLQTAVDALGLSEVQLVHARAEEAGGNPAHREQYDVALTRALADMTTLVELCLPLVRVGGHLVAQKSRDVQDELDAARPITGQLGGKVERVKQIALPGTDIVRHLVVFSKTKPCPERFPRGFAKISRAKH